MSNEEIVSTKSFQRGINKEIINKTLKNNCHVVMNLQTQCESQPVPPGVFLLLCAVFPREERSHPSGLLRPPQRLPAVGPGRLDPGEDRPPGAARRRAAAARGAGPSGGGAEGGAHPQALQLIQRHRTNWTEAELLMQFFNILLVSTLWTTLR